MTCIAAVTHRGKIWMAGDSLLSGSEGGPPMEISTPKVWERDDVLIGAAGDLAWVLLLRRTEWTGDLERIASKLDTGDGTALIGVRGKLWYVSSESECVELRERYYAIGDAAPYALGALSVSQAGPARRVEEAVRVAARYCPGSVGGRINVVSR